MENERGQNGALLLGKQKNKADSRPKYSAIFAFGIECTGVSGFLNVSRKILWFPLTKMDNFFHMICLITLPLLTEASRSDSYFRFCPDNSSPLEGRSKINSKFSGTSMNLASSSLDLGYLKISPPSSSLLLTHILE